MQRYRGYIIVFVLIFLQIYCSYVCSYRFTSTYLLRSSPSSTKTRIREKNMEIPTETTALASTSSSKGIAVLWDVDGTLSDSYLLGYSSTNAVLQQHGKACINEEEYHEGTKYTTPRRLAWHVTGNPDDAIGIELGDEFDRLYVELVSSKTAALYPGITDLLNTIQQQYPYCRFGALSNACTAYVEAVLIANDLRDKFDVALGADKVLAAKPAPEGLWQCCEILQLPPQRCIYIGDSPTDGQAATAAGMKSIGVTWGSHVEEKIVPNFSLTVQEVTQLFPAIQSLLDNCHL